jgi:sortase A
VIPPVRTALRVVGDLFITVGLVIALFAVYELYGTGIYTAHAQSKLRATLQHEWATPTPTPTPTASPKALPSPPPLQLGSGIAILRIPRFGKNYEQVIVEGVESADLAKGPGHYPGSAMPGQIGNFVVSGHRTTHGAPFNRLDELRPGDAVVIETQTTWFTYKVVREEVVDPSDLDVIAAVPDQPGAQPTQAWLTFTTCDPKYSAAHRRIMFALLDSSQPRAAGLPPALTG